MKIMEWRTELSYDIDLLLSVNIHHSVITSVNFTVQIHYKYFKDKKTLLFGYMDFKTYETF